MLLRFIPHAKRLNMQLGVRRRVWRMSPAEIDSQVEERNVQPTKRMSMIRIRPQNHVRMMGIRLSNLFYHQIVRHSSGDSALLLLRPLFSLFPRFCLSMSSSISIEPIHDSRLDRICMLRANICISLLICVSKNAHRNVPFVDGLFR